MNSFFSEKYLIRFVGGGEVQGFVAKTPRGWVFFRLASKKANLSEKKPHPQIFPSQVFLKSVFFYFQSVETLIFRNQSVGCQSVFLNLKKYSVLLQSVFWILEKYSVTFTRFWLFIRKVLGCDLVGFPFFSKNQSVEVQPVFALFKKNTRLRLVEDYIFRVQGYLLLSTNVGVYTFYVIYF